jgi:hypothetical protein
MATREGFEPPTYGSEDRRSDSAELPGHATLDISTPPRDLQRRYAAPSAARVRCSPSSMLIRGP